MSDAAGQPHFTAHLKGIGGVAKSEPETFTVEEIEAYAPCGHGDHVFLWVQKRDVSAGRLLEILSKHYNVSRNDIGTAGNKDRRALTRQWVSIPATDAEEVTPGEIETGVEVLQAIRHTNKLRTNHLRGNRFVIEIRDLAVPVDEAVVRSRAILELLERLGTPNFFGEQRFGRGGSTLTMGLELVAGRVPHRLKKDRRLKRLAASAVQSAIFNEVLRGRMETETTHTALLGDRLNRTTERGQLLVTAANIEEAQAGIERGELAVTGPMVGPKMYEVTDDVLALEDSALGVFGLRREQFAALRKLTPGTRRDLFARFLEPPLVAATPDAVRIGFSLPSGAYATVVLAELTKLDFSPREAP